MDFYAGVVYPLVLVVSGALAVLGIATLITMRAHALLRWARFVTWAAVVIHVVTVIAVLIAGNSADLILTLGYLLASLVLPALLGIGRLGTPEAKAAAGDDRPVLAPDQVVRVDAIAALIVAVALAVLAWRVDVILVAAA